MKIIVEIPADITSIKDKYIGLTKRQIVCIAVVLFIGIPSFFLLKIKVNEDAAQYALLFIAAACFAFLRKKNDLPLEVYLKFLLRRHFTPMVRPYRIENIYEYLITEDASYEQLQAKAKKATKGIKGKGKTRSKKHKKDTQDSATNPSV